MFPTVRLPITHFARVAAVLGVAVVVVILLSLAGPVIAGLHIIVFYLITIAAYAALPFVRRGDIFMVAMWLVLGGGIAPCFAGQEISAQYMFGDMTGVLLAAAPIYIARFRQLAQGDVRAAHRREGDPVAGGEPSRATRLDGLLPN